MMTLKAFIIDWNNLGYPNPNNTAQNKTLFMLSSVRIIFFAIFFGVLSGYILGEHALYVKILGDVFLRLIKMIIVPVVFFAILSGITASGDLESVKKIGVKALFVYGLATIFAVLIGFFTGFIFKPGENIHLTLSNMKNIPEHISFLETFIPENAIGAMAKGNIVQVVFFALFSGVCILKLDNNESMIKGIKNLSRLVFKMVSIIVKLAPLAAFSFTCWLVGTQGIEIFLKLSKLIFSFLSAGIIQFLVFAIMIILFKGVSPVMFFKKSVVYQSIALSTSSTKAALLPAINLSEKSLGISSKSARFILPLGASINMSGMAIYFGLCALFVAQAIGRSLSIYDYLTIAFSATIGSIGGAGIPSGTMIMLPMVFSSVGLPIEAIGVIASIDRIADMIRSMISITGDVALTLCIDDEFDKEKYLNQE